VGQTTRILLGLQRSGMLIPCHAAVGLCMLVCARILRLISRCPKICDRPFPVRPGFKVAQTFNVSQCSGGISDGVDVRLQRNPTHSSVNQCIGDDTKAAARQSPNCIKNKKIKFGEKRFSIWQMEI